MVHIRRAKEEDLIAILDIYNQGIRDRIATLETEEKDLKYMSDWFLQRSDKYAVLTAAIGNEVAGWASLNPYSHRCAYRGVADLSIYISRSYRGRGIGKALLASIEKEAVDADIHKIVLFTFRLP
ncbi:GNAT family N-acetyltransferase [Bacillus atrophaeus]|uniref:GNAT family N-acetyltransferase n=1 Tax=Bacillus atrophaeus TaxID=1452 RepID=UPI001BAD53FC|nr:GNAT family N-acetyltransferase [Bacillus atrophaeus]QUF64824.1 N-acetyltransferase [Bacillus atrophaeus]